MKREFATALLAALLLAGCSQHAPTTSPPRTEPVPAPGKTESAALPPLPTGPCSPGNTAMDLPANPLGDSGTP